MTTQNEQSNIAKMQRMDTVALQRIMDDPATKPGSWSVERPLAGLVRIAGIGSVPVRAIQAELATRTGG